MDAYIASNFNARIAAQRAGFGSPEVKGNYLAREVPQIQDAIDERLRELRNTLRMEAEEVLEITTKVARDFKHPGQMRALEILGKVHGLFSDTLPFELDRSKLLRAIHAELDRISGGVIDAEAKLIPENVEGKPN